MKKYFLFLCVFVILSACTNTIGYLPDDEPKKLIVNAMMQTENNDNRIYLHYKDGQLPLLSPMVSYTCISTENCQKQSLRKMITTQ